MGGCYKSLEILGGGCGSERGSKWSQVRRQFKPVFHWTEFSTWSGIFLCLVSYKAELIKKTKKNSAARRDENSAARRDENSG